MGRIRILPDHVINKIAAGEVVERPSSVVKELMENAIDAGGTEIVVEVQQGGRDVISVADNGCGMDAEDVTLAGIRHSTSKISAESDLERITTMGFRGEALSSISAVSRLTLISRTEREECGTCVEIEGGVRKDTKKVSRSVGTTVEVRDLFFNTPARRKFLKTVPTEMSHISSILNQMVLVNVSVGFRLIHQKHELLSVPAGSDILARIETLYGADLAKELIPLSAESQLLKISGFIARPSYTRSDRYYQFTFVNKRPVVNKSLSHAIYEAYDGLLPADRYPVSILFIVIACDQVDVNVHPAKREVRFRDEKKVHDIVAGEIKRALKSAGLIREIFPVEPASGGTKSSYHMPVGFLAPGSRPDPLVEEARGLYSVSKLHPAASPAVDASSGTGPFFGPFVQLRNSYIVTQDEEGILIIDQHAAHERIVYEDLVKRLRSASLELQHLFPVSVELPLSDVAVIEENMVLLNSLGFEMEGFGRNTFVIRAVPALLGKVNPKRLLLDMIDDLRHLDRTDGLEKLKEKTCHIVACHAAIRAGDRLSPEEIIHLIKRLSACDISIACPHGRPTTVRLTWSELEKRLART
jgi:DNA mismatch repair protein MutL